jgi:transcription-repair coupling factor (superfamily II helicase)
VVAPTTVLTFQHLETFKKRFAKWPVVIKSLNRFVSQKEITQTLKELKEGKVDIVIGTHRLFSQDVQFKDLGLMIVDEEQRFGVKHKERLRKIKGGLDTLAMSATPIPRTLNLSLVGIRDLSLINTAPVDRLATRTFVTKFNSDTIRKAITSEVARGGQIYFIHNRVQSIHGLADELRKIVPEVRFKVAHGQMEEGQLEKVMVEFFHHEIDMLVCTTIVESGMDVSSANTIFIDNSQQLGLSQLYQLRGRVGRSKERAYCYLMVPPNGKIDKDAQERLRIIQENTALGSGIRIAQYDLELRGAGDILGEEQAGHVNAVGYELYLELLEDAVRTAKGEAPLDSDVEPEINVRIPALIPDKYIPDLRVRLAYYKSLSDIESPEDIDRIEDELRDQFGKPPDQVINLMGLMLIRHVCKDLSVRDLSSGESSVTLAFTEKTKLPPQKVIELASRANKKYSITPDNRLRVRINEITWPRIHDELIYLQSLC